MPNEINEKKVSAFKIARRIACSVGLLFIVLAPLLWGLLPLGYTYIKQDPVIKANPTFIVFMRMFCGFIVTMLGLGLYLLWTYLRKTKFPIKDMLLRNWRTSLIFIALLSACYVGARIVEMKCILGFSFEEKQENSKTNKFPKYITFTNDVRATQIKHPYLTQGPDKDDKELLVKDINGLTNDVESAKLMQLTNAIAKIANEVDVVQKICLERNNETRFSDDFLSKLDTLTNFVSKAESVEEIKKKWMKNTPNDNMASASTSAIQEFGYFMGLLLSLILVVKNHKVYGFLSECAKKLKLEKITEKFKKQKGTPISFLGGLSMFITFFLIIASGVLNLAAREPLYAWSGIWEMLGWAFLVAILTSFAADFKGASSLCDGIDDGKENEKKKVDTKQLDEETCDCGKEDCPVCNIKVDEGCDKNSAAIFSSLVINAIMSLFAALIAIVFWWGCDLSWGKECSFQGKFLELWKSFFAHGGMCVWFLVVIVILCSVIAPVCMLYGTQMHDNFLKKVNLDKYGISGKDWMQILAACEPLFVVIIGYFVMGGDSFISSWPIWLSVGTVLFIILLRIMEMWAEKDSVLRNYVFTKVRGSSRGIFNKDKTETNDIEYAKKRAENLTWLKLYNKRDALSDYKCKLNASSCKSVDEIIKHPAVDAANEDASNKFHGQIDKSFYFVIEGCDKYFTQDDPFTHDVLSAIFDWLQLKQLNKGNYIQIDSFKYLFYSCCENENHWKNDEKTGLKDIACRESVEATPFAVMVRLTAGDPLEVIAKDVITCLNRLLMRIKKAVDKHELSGLVYGVVDEELNKMRDEKNK